MFDNSQFLGHFDPNNVNIESISNSGNKSQSSMEYTGFGGSFNPVEVNKAYFNPNGRSNIFKRLDNIPAFISLGLNTLLSAPPPDRRPGINLGLVLLLLRLQLKTIAMINIGNRTWKSQIKLCSLTL
jgi:hypothetical protein